MTSNQRRAARVEPPSWLPAAPAAPHGQGDAAATARASAAVARPAGSVRSGAGSAGPHTSAPARPALPTDPRAATPGRMQTRPVPDGTREGEGTGRPAPWVFTPARQAARDKATQARRRATREAVATYGELRDPQGPYRLTVRKAAERMGVCQRTGERYEARRKAATT